MFPLSSGLVKNTLDRRKFGDGPITRISYPSGSKCDSSSLSQSINSNYLNIGLNCFPLFLRKTNSLSSAIVTAAFAPIVDLIGYCCF